jgi:hypothetical protein
MLHYLHVSVNMYDSCSINKIIYKYRVIHGHYHTIHTHKICQKKTCWASIWLTIYSNTTMVLGGIKLGHRQIDNFIYWYTQIYNF